MSEITLHGHRVTYREAGAGSGGPVVVLLHGIAGSGQTWDPVLPLLGERFTVIAPDMLGHGGSAKPRGDYSLGAYASAVRDLMAALGHDSATVVGHSLGGGIAMQFAYQFPERLDRLVLVSSGGLGREVAVMLRAAALPGADWVLPLMVNRRFDGFGRKLATGLNRVGFLAAADLDELARGFASLKDTSARQAFLHTVRSVIDVGGQRVDASDRLYLAEEVPTMLVWGEKDRVIPVRHGLLAQQKMPGSRMEVLPDAGHFPHIADPERFARIMFEFVEQTDAAQVDAGLLRERLLNRTAAAS
ncbi:MAG: Hydrolase, alpha/beta fold family [uncultured Solirubrobacteraceae bacterium]|uniref:Hydrolase, alpha/beta fold family n=1 Tax=uncultured Solirubrobacteraceae bacterium TaxID=1162706 RepID=A0A6J4U3Q4_9ACTN|nr:MAG: Hydrolase, alpha/beta fold family [uncultured Solirubrobacteraceae bacterium]